MRLGMTRGRRSFGEAYPFPYRFGYRADQRDQLRRLLANENVKSGIECAYKGLLNAISEGNMANVAKMVEGRLYKKIKEDHERLEEGKFSFLLQHPQADVRATIYSETIYMSASIDRASEIQNMLGRPFIWGNFKAYFTNITDSTCPIISQLKARVETKLKLNLKNAYGELLLDDPDLKERHDIVIEGLIYSKSMFDILTWGGYRELKQAVYEGSFLDVTIVDIDNALKGNPHVGE